MTTQPKPLHDPQADKLRQIQTIPALVKYLDEELGWPIHVDEKLQPDMTRVPLFQCGSTRGKLVLQICHQVPLPPFNPHSN